MKLFLVSAALLVIAAPSVSNHSARLYGQAEAASASDELKSLPQIKLADFEGKPVSSEGLKGRILVLDFWATWCGPCLAEVPMLNGLQEKYGDKGLKVVGVTLTSGEAKEVKPFVARYKMKYTVLMGDDDQAYDLNIMGFPTTYLVTRDWKVYRKYLGAGPSKAQQLESDIKTLLAAENGSR